MLYLVFTVNFVSGRIFPDAFLGVPSEGGGTLHAFQAKFTNEDLWKASEVLGKRALVPNLKKSNKNA